MPRIPQSRSAGALPGAGKATSGLQQNGGFVLGDSSRMTWGTIDMNSDGPTAAMVKGWPRWAIPGFLEEVPPRLEGCRQRLLAAEIELGRAEKAGGLDIGSSAPPEAESDVPAVLQDLPPLFGPDDGPDEFAELPHEGEMLLEQVSELESQLASMTGKFNDLNAGHVAARHLRNSYSTQLKSSTDQIASLSRRVSELVEQLEVSQSQNEALKEKIIASRENTQKLQRQYLDKGKELSHSEYQCRKIEQLLESTRGVVNDYQQKLEVSEGEQDTLRSRIRELQEAERANKELNKEAREEADQRIEELEDALQECETSMETLRQEKEAVQKQKQELSESLQSQKNQTVAQQKAVDELRKTQSSEEQVKETMRKQLDQASKEIEALNLQVQEMQNIQTKEDQPAAEHSRRPDGEQEDLARIKKLEESLREVERQKQDQEKLVQEKEKEVEVLNLKLKDMQRPVEHTEHQPEAEHATADPEEADRIKRLEEALRDAKKSVEEVRTQKEDVEKQKQEQEKLMEEKDKELEVLNRKLAEMQTTEAREQQPEAEHTTLEQPEADRIKKLEETLQEVERQKQDQEKLVQEKEREVEVLNLKLRDMQRPVEHSEHQPEAEHATADPEEADRIKRLEEALRDAKKSVEEVRTQKEDVEKQKQEQEKLMEEKDKELEVLNHKLAEMQTTEAREQQPEAEHTTPNDVLRDTEGEKQQQEAMAAQEKLVAEKDQEIEALRLKLKEMDNMKEPEEPAAATAKEAVSKWVESATHEEWLSQWDSENVTLAVPVVMAGGVYEHGSAPSRVGLKGADFLIQPLLPAGPPQRWKLSSVKSIFATQSQPDMSQSVSLVVDVDEGGQTRQLQLSSDEESAEAILATLTRDVRVMPGEELNRR